MYVAVMYWKYSNLEIYRKFFAIFQASLFTKGYAKTAEKYMFTAILLEKFQFNTFIS